MSHTNFDIMQDSLLTADQICEKLSISRSTLDRWRGANTRITVGRIVKMNDDEPIIPFPKPTLNIGRSPRWSASEINLWIKRLQNGKL